MPDLDHPYFPLIVALGIGLLIGAERERRKGEGPFRAAAGIPSDLHDQVEDYIRRHYYP